MSRLFLLGPQRPDPNAPAALSEIEGDGPVVTITAGWRHDETEDEALRRHLGPEVSVLPLYGWFEIVMRELPELRAAYRARQDALLRLSHLHRLRLIAAVDAVRTLLGEDHDAAGRAQLAAAVEDVRRVDRQLLDAFRVAREEAPLFELWEQYPLLENLRSRAITALRDARAVVITGGHVAVLRNRLAFFGLGPVLSECFAGGTPFIAWSAGAMVLTERVVLFYDDPPEGASAPEVLDRGLGLVRDTVLLPHARQRLALDDARRVELLVARFAPARCITLEHGAWLHAEGGRWTNRGPAGTASELQSDGSVVSLPGPARGGL